MQNKSIFSIGTLTLLCSPFVMGGQSSRVIDITNNSSQALQVAVNGDSSFKLEQNVPAYSEWHLISQLTKIKSSQEILLEAILNDSVVEIREAILIGASIHQHINGKSPLAWALLFKKYQALQILVALGTL